MNARKHRQKQLTNDWALGEGCVAVNDRVWFEDRDGVRMVCVGNTPLYAYDLKDRVQHLFCACQLIEARLAKQCAVIGAFGISERTLQRCRRKMRKEGIGGLVPQKKGPKRRHKGGGAVGRRIVKLWTKGHGREEIAARLGLSEGTVRSVLKEQGLYPRPQTPQPSLPLGDSVEPQPSEEGEPDDGEPCVARSDLSAQEVKESNAAVEVTSIAYASPVNQLATVLGLVEEAPVEFAPARNVPVAGVLLGLALLSTTGLMEEAREVYGRLKNCWYGLRATVWRLFIMALLRIRRPEQLKGFDPAAVGQVLGLPRAPEVKTVRRKLAEPARRGKAVFLHRRLAQRRAGQHEEALAYLYVDGHVRAYSGKRQIGKAYVTTRKSVLRAETDYWVNPDLLTCGVPQMTPSGANPQRSVCGNAGITVIAPVFP